MLIVRLLLLAVSATLLAACVSRSEAVTPQDVQTLYKKWSARSQSYEVSFQQLCFCMPDYVRPMRLSVHDNVIMAAQYEDDQSSVAAAIIADLMTIDAMYQTILNAEARPAHSVKVEYHPQLAFPTRVDIDFDQRMADDEIHWQLSHLTVPGHQ